MTVFSSPHNKHALESYTDYLEMSFIRFGNKLEAPQKPDLVRSPVCKIVGVLFVAARFCLGLVNF